MPLLGFFWVDQAQDSDGGSGRAAADGAQSELKYIDRRLFVVPQVSEVVG